MGQIKITISTKLKAGIKLDKDVGVYVAFAPSLGVFSQGANITEAKRALKNAVNSFLRVAHRKNLLISLMQSKSVSLGDGEYISIAEERILKEQHYNNIFDINADLKDLPYSSVAVNG